MVNLASVVWQDMTSALLLGVHGAQAPSDAEWDLYCSWIPDLLKQPNPGCVVMTDGGAPTSAQREQMRKHLSREQCWTAVITDKALVRGVVTAIRWFNPKICAFAPWEVHEAFRFVGVAGDQIPRICETLRALDQKLVPRSRVLPEALKYLAAPEAAKHA
jgi:hypothetical protein